LLAVWIGPGRIHCPLYCGCSRILETSSNKEYLSNLYTEIGVVSFSRVQTNFLTLATGWPMNFVSLGMSHCQYSSCSSPHAILWCCFQWSFP
jgi:hypothetical protein